DQTLGQVTLQPIADVGFNSNGSPLKGIPPANPPVFTTPTGAFPNALNAVVIKGRRAYLPNNASSPDGPVLFNVNVQAFLNVIDTTTDQEAVADNKPQSINMNRGINFEPSSERKLFVGMPWQIAFKHSSDEGYAVSLGGNMLVKVD